MQDKIGFIGLGAMGGALLEGLLAGGVEPERIVASDTLETKLREAAEKHGLKAMPDVRSVAEAARVIFVAVKPQDMKTLLKEIAPVMKDGQVVVSVAAGVSIHDIEKRFDREVGVIRVMPNTPCLVGEGAMAASGGKYVSDDDLHMVVSWLETLGIVRTVPEKLMDAVTGVSGSGPAYVYLMIEALADGGVLNGLPRAMALELAAQTVLGAARMVMETGEHPAVLREMVTSPGGTTAQALFTLEDNGFPAAVQKAVSAAAQKSKELGK
ncbi:pyrroline-5-carboxylate reductase [Dethiobacter alkaliphilus]|uniref:Pyrroline-5-carboxylate reductase n=1 Tax=Dethiobacter alkaliphilus AHT 1 TaxID=555088 RepID=C0GHT1_DETAL|nr:pyrroline-5-carboxylate reductase [Dethiobacter alkaliphilus]EEG77005.1 pyrroline-5-carboxylate reductase [Dethiobacter alkaliphilus AHT 1]MCW3489583.1 pyrroline-5-carboxylate reductase [Dethiobacter alkaliphilus]